MEIIPVYFRGGSLPLRPGHGPGLPPLRGFHPRNAPELLPDNSRGVFPADIFMPKAVYILDEEKVTFVRAGTHSDLFFLASFHFPLPAVNKQCKT
jgi:hypothetical protein